MKFEDVVFLRVWQVEEMHSSQLQKHGGTDGCINPGMLQSAVEKPKATFDGVPLYPSLGLMAASVMFSITKYHPFQDGNKRTALVAGLTFLRTNGVRVPFDPKWENIMLGVASGTMTERELYVAVSTEMGQDVPVED